MPRRALLSGSFGVSVGIERRRACPFTDGQREARKREIKTEGEERERERDRAHRV